MFPLQLQRANHPRTDSLHEVSNMCFLAPTKTVPSEDSTCLQGAIPWNIFFIRFSKTSIRSSGSRAYRMSVKKHVAVQSFALTSFEGISPSLPLNQPPPPQKNNKLAKPQAQTLRFKPIFLWTFESLICGPCPPSVFGWLGVCLCISCFAAWTLRHWSCPRSQWGPYTSWNSGSTQQRIFSLCRLAAHWRKCTCLGWIVSKI